MKKRRFSKWNIAGVSIALILFVALIRAHHIHQMHFHAWLAGYPYKKCPTHGCVLRRCYLYRQEPHISDAPAKVLYGPQNLPCELYHDQGEWYFYCPLAPPSGGLCS